MKADSYHTPTPISPLRVAQGRDDSRMLLSILLYAGIFLVPVSVLLLIPQRTRPFSVWLVLVGIVMVAIALAWPAREERVTSATTHLDQAMPVWQFNERHATHVNASPQRVFDSIRPVTAGEIRFFRTLIAIRRLGRPLPPGILNAPENKPLLDLATRTSFRYVANDPPREIVVETIIVRPRAVIATMNFLVTPDGDGSLLSTETRVFATNDTGLRRFKIYWRVIRPGSDIIRRSWLFAIKKRAEAGA